MKFNVKKLALGLLVATIGAVPLPAHAVYEYVVDAVGYGLEAFVAYLKPDPFRGMYVIRTNSMLMGSSKDDPRQVISYILQQIKTDDTQPEMGAYKQLSQNLLKLGDKYPVVTYQGVQIFFSTPSADIKKFLEQLIQDQTTLSTKQQKHLGWLAVCFAISNQLELLKAFIPQALKLVEGKHFLIEECKLNFLKHKNQEAVTLCTDLHYYFSKQFKKIPFKRLIELNTFLDDKKTRKQIENTVMVDYVINRKSPKGLMNKWYK